MSFTTLGRKLLRQMINMNTDGASSVTFNLFDNITYDPVTGSSTEPFTTDSILCFVKYEDPESRTGAIISTKVEVSLEAGVIQPRDPRTQDELTIGDDTYKITEVTYDPGKVEMCVYAVIA